MPFTSLTNPQYGFLFGEKQESSFGGHFDLFKHKALALL